MKDFKIKTKKDLTQVKKSLNEIRTSLSNLKENPNPDSNIQNQIYEALYEGGIKHLERIIKEYQLENGTN